jgi:predicted HD phosphohydrolase
MATAYTGQSAAWNGIKNQVGAKRDLVADREPTFTNLPPENQKEWLESGVDPILETDYAEYLRAKKRYANTPSDTKVTDPLAATNGSKGKGNGKS